MIDDQKWNDELNKECEISFSSGSNEDPDMFRAVAKTIVGDVGKTLEETWALWELDSDSDQIRENFHLLKQRLAYLFKFCEGKV